jgi:hypothetical protein
MSGKIAYILVDLAYRLFTGLVWTLGIVAAFVIFYILWQVLILFF